LFINLSITGLTAEWVIFYLFGQFILQLAILFDTHAIFQKSYPQCV
jgi:hypothetical protein